MAPLRCISALPVTETADASFLKLWVSLHCGLILKDCLQVSLQDYSSNCAQICQITSSSVSAAAAPWVDGMTEPASC
uniref:Secreted protein n=1 Tax=Panagrellus redivivus TaxID=6233 RepID=A0A7E4VC67_PANRE